MKFLIALDLLFCFACYSQPVTIATKDVEEVNTKINAVNEFKAFKVGIGFGYAIPGKGPQGVLFYLEAMYRMEDNISFGLRMEEARIYGSGHAATRSVSLNFQYYFSKNVFRPFIGFGYGSFFGGMTSINGVEQIGGTPSGGYYPRVGFDFGHFNLSIDYNVISAKNVTTTQSAIFTFTTTEIKPSFNYIALRLGVSMGGGRK